MQKVVFDINGGTQTEDVWEYHAEVNIWAQEGWSDERTEKTT
jgi:hypothetical protein